jgi:hypothetical protein
MKILLVHPDDSVEAGAWAGMRWDMVVDLGWSGRNAYAQQCERLGARVFSIFDLFEQDSHLRSMRELFAPGLDKLVDSDSVDWWDAFSVYPYQQIEQLLLLSALAEEIPEHAEVFATRADMRWQALSLLRRGEGKGKGIGVLSAEGRVGVRDRTLRRVRSAVTFRPAQLAEIAFDKWDVDYRLRRHFAPAVEPNSTPRILLPSAYVNVSRAQVAYARMLPQRRFLLVTTRRSGRLPALPKNVECVSLAAYAKRAAPFNMEEHDGLSARWRAVRDEMSARYPVLRLADQLHLFDGFSAFLKTGLRVRDAWRQVFARENIAAVFSADENSPYTRLPVWLAKSRGLRTVFCDHGALNATFAIRRMISDTYLVRGEMAQDYCIAWNGIPPDKIVVGAPAERPTSPATAGSGARDWIVFYSESYELFSGRTPVLYAELLPELCRLAEQTNRKVIVKLHPFESLRERTSLADSVLTAEQRRYIVMREGPMTPDLFARAWCSFTVESSVAVESTVNGVPCFLCSWFDTSPYGYGKQYAKFSAGYRLSSPRQIREVPELLSQFQINEVTRQRLQSPISPQDLDRILS